MNQVESDVTRASNSVRRIGLFLIGFQGQVPGREVERQAEQLMKPADAVTAAIHGRDPREGGPRGW